MGRRRCDGRLQSEATRNETRHCCDVWYLLAFGCERGCEVNLRQAIQQYVARDNWKALTRAGSGCDICTGMASLWLTSAPACFALPELHDAIDSKENKAGRLPCDGFDLVAGMAFVVNAKSASRIAAMLSFSPR